MGWLREHTRLAGAIAVCVVAVVGVVVGVALTRDGSGGATRLPTTGDWAPITVTRAEVPVIGGGVAVDVDPTKERKDFGTTLAILPGKHRYELTLTNISDLGMINSLQWYPPSGLHIVKVLSSSAGRCTLSGLKGFGGNLFPTVVLYPNILCEDVNLKAPSCTCLGDGGILAIRFVTEADVAVVAGDARVRTATLVYKRIPGYLGGGSSGQGSG